MKPLMLQGHERSITQIKYNEQGDLLFSASKDAQPNVWYAINGERLGTYDGHAGTVWSIDVKWDSSVVATGSGDQSIGIWDTATGKSMNFIKMLASVRGVKFSYCGNLLAYTTDKMMGQEGELKMIDLREPNCLSGEPIIKVQITPARPKALSVLWGPLDRYFVTGHENGAIIKWDARTGKLMDQSNAHNSQINDLQLNHDQSLLITASKDCTARLYDIDSFKCIKMYQTDRPVNSAAITPLLDKHPHVLLGGGQEAMDVTTTSAKAAKFEARFFHLVFEEEFARVRGHFGPINSLAFHPNGRGYASGGEDGFIRVHVFDDSYYEYKFDY